jgi:hypothetical protein
MRAEYALGPVRRARRVEDGCEVVGVDRNLGRDRRAVDQRGQVDDARRQRSRGLAVVEASAHEHNTMHCVRMRGESLESLAVGDKDAGLAVFEAERELCAVPEGVERGGDRAGDDAREEGHRPLRQVAGGDRDTVALAHAELVDQCRRELTNPVTVLRVRQSLVTEHDQVAWRRQRAPAVEDRPDGSRRLLPRWNRAAVHDRRLDLERRARRSERRIDLLDRPDALAGHHVAVRPATNSTSWNGADSMESSTVCCSLTRYPSVVRTSVQCTKPLESVLGFRSMIWVTKR